MKLEFSQPEFLWTLLFFVALAWTFRRSLADLSQKQGRVLLAVRSLIFVLLVFSLAGLSLRSPCSETMCVFLVDTSRSIDENASRLARDFVTKTQEHLENTTCALMEFDATPRLAVADEPVTKKGSREETNIAAAIKPAQAIVPPHCTGHLVLLSDGNETEGDALRTAIASGVRISVVPLPVSPEPEVQLVELRAPSNVRQGEPFHLEILVRCNTETDGLIRVYRDDFKLIEQRETLNPGENLLRYPLQAGEDRQQLYTALLVSNDDSIHENNSATITLACDGPPRVLLLESDPELVLDFTAALREQAIEVETRAATEFPQTLEELNRYEAVIVSDVPATAFSVAQMELLRNYVRDLGGGFLMLGGERSFGLGAYSETVLDDLLPVRCKFEKEEEKPSLAMCLIIDRSGSMQGEKIELAKDAAQSVVELLNARDYVTVIAFDATPHTVVAAQNVVSPAVIRSQIARVSAEGGTSIYPALLRAHQELQGVPAKLKHAILLSDGQSERGDFETITRQMRDESVTLTTIGIGDADHDLLGRLAEIGQGRYYRCEDPREIPQIFARETITAGKSALEEIPFIPVTITRSEILSGLNLDEAPPLLGFVKTEPKPTSRSILVTETGEPLLVVSRYGLGVCIAFTSDVKSRWASEWLAWDSFGSFWGQVLRYTMRKTNSGRSRTGLLHDGNRTILVVDALDVENGFLNKATGHVNVFGPGGLKTEIPLQQIGPGRYEASVPCRERGAYVFQPQLQDEQGKPIPLPSRSLSIGYPKELQLKGTNTELLKKIAKATGGLYDPSPEELGRYCHENKEAATSWKTRPLWPWLLAVVICLFVFDVFLRRVDFVR